MRIHTLQLKFLPCNSVNHRASVVTTRSLCMLQLLPVMGLSLTHPTGCLYKASWTLGVYKVLEQKPSNSKYLGGWGEGRNVRKEKNKDVGTHRAYNHELVSTGNQKLRGQPCLKLVIRNPWYRNCNLSSDCHAAQTLKQAQSSRMLSTHLLELAEN